MTNKKKGRLLEDLVAQIHEAPDVKIDKRVNLPVLNSKLTREIDVLLSTQAAGYPVRLAISCKNEKSKLGIKEVGDFYTALKEVGIPVQLGILVSVAGFTKPAQASAKLKGIRTLIYKGLSRDRLNQEINAALQSVLYLLASVSSISALPYVEDQTRSSPSEFIAEIDFLDMPSEYQMMNCIWKMWINKNLPEMIGTHIAMIRPKNPAAHWAVIAEVNVAGLIESIRGTFSSGTLYDAQDDQLERHRVNAKFDRPHATVPLSTIESEGELANLAKDVKFHVLTRVRVPRLVSKTGYWPPTMQEAERAKQLFEEGKPVSFDELGIINLADAWRTDR